MRLKNFFGAFVFGLFGLGLLLYFFLWTPGAPPALPRFEGKPPANLEIGEELTPPDEQTSLTLESRGAKTCRLEVVVFGPDNERIPGATVWADKYPGGDGQGQVWKTSTGKRAAVKLTESGTDEEDARGVYQADSFQPGTWRISARAPGYATGRTEVRLPREEVAHLKLETGFTLHGRVVARSGSAVEGASIVLLDPMGSRTQSSDENGEFSISSLARGAGALVVNAQGYWRRQVEFHLPRDLELELILSLSAGMSGRVLAADGSPAPGAYIYTTSESTSTDAAGKFLLDKLPPGAELSVLVDYPDHAPLELSSVPLRAGEVVDFGDVALSVGTSLRFGVKSASGTDPAGVEIQLHANSKTLEKFPPNRGRRSGLVEKDTLLVTGLVPGEYWIVVPDPRYGGVDPREIEILEVSDAASDFPLILLGRRGLAGRVEDDNGEPIRGARVRLETNPLNILPVEFKERVTHTGTGGEFLLQNLRDEEYIIEVTADGFASLSRLKLAPGEPEEDPHVLRLGRLYSARGWVVDTAGRAVGDAKVELKIMKNVTGVTKVGSGLAASTKTDDSGKFEVSRLISALYAVNVTANDHLKIQATLELEGPGPIELDPFVLSPGYALSGRVLNAAGEPREGVHVRVRVETVDNAFEDSTQTESDGSYALHFQGRGVARMEFQSDDITTKIDGVEVPGEVPDLILAEVLIQGSVLNPLREPVQRFVLEVPTGGVSAQEIESTEGIFELTLSPGRHRIFASAPGHASSEPEVLDLEAGEKLRDLELVLREAHRIHGEVVDVRGELAEGASILVEGADPNGAPYSAHARAGTGQFSFENLSAGIYEVSAISADLKSNTVSAVRVELRDGEESPPIRLELATMATITGRVLQNEFPVAQAHVSLPTKNVHESALLASRRGRTDSRGMFVLENVPAGKHQLTVTWQDGFYPGPEVEVRHGEVTHVDVELPSGVAVEGRIYLSTGEPISDAHVQGTSGETVVTTTTTRDGLYRLSAVPEGTISLALQRGPSASWRTLETILVDGNENPIRRDYELETAEVALWAHSENGTPVSQAAFYLWPTGSSLSGRPTAMQRGSTSGTTRFDFLEPGRYLCAAYHRERALAFQLVEASLGTPESFISIEMLSPGGLEIHCTDEAGQPMSGARVALVGNGGRDVVAILAAFAGKPNLVTGPKGILKFRHLKPGAYQLDGRRGKLRSESKVLVRVGELRRVDAVFVGK